MASSILGSLESTAKLVERSIGPRRSSAGPGQVTTPSASGKRWVVANRAVWIDDLGAPAGHAREVSEIVGGGDGTEDEQARSGGADVDEQVAAPL